MSPCAPSIIIRGFPLLINPFQGGVYLRGKLGKTLQGIPWPSGGLSIRCWHYWENTRFVFSNQNSSNVQFNWIQLDPIGPSWGCWWSLPWSLPWYPLSHCCQWLLAHDYPLAALQPSGMHWADLANGSTWSPWICSLQMSWIQHTVGWFLLCFVVLRIWTASISFI